jgi:DNA-binding transcriptional LysR family regulator
LEDLANHQLIHYVGTFGSRPMGFEYRDGSGYRTLDMSSVITVNSAEAYQESCLAGLGIIQAPAAGVRHLIEANLLVEVAPDLRAEPMPVSLVYVQRRNLSRRVQVLMSWVAEVMKPHCDTVS